jgi:hypothetical protein
MTDGLDLGTRIRAANPIASVPAPAPPAELLARIMSTPSGSRRQRRRYRRSLALAGIALLVAAGLAIAGTISVRYFDDSGSTSLPAPVERALTRTASHFGPVRTLDLTQAITAYSFSSATASGRVYVAPYQDHTGFCAVLAVTGKVPQGACSTGSNARPRSATLAPFQPWNVALTPDLHAMLGRLGPDDGDVSVRVAFEDGASEELPRHGRWFAYVVAGTHTEPGHRPVDLRYLRDGRVVRHSPLFAPSFNTLAAARALVPRSDGSPAQNAVRAELLGELGTHLGDGGSLASRVELTKTSTATTVRLDPTLRVTLYVTPVRPLKGMGLTGGYLLIGLDGRSSKPVMTFSASGSRRSSQLQQPFECTCGVMHHPGVLFSVMSGPVPTGVSRIDVRTSDGRLHRATIILGGQAWAWMGPWSGTSRPAALVGRDASGARVTSLRLRGLRGP